MILLTAEISGTDIVTTYKTLVFLFGAIIAVWGVIKTIKEIRQPTVELKKTVDEHTEKIGELESHLKRSDEGMAIVQQSLLQMMNHMIDGDHREQLVKARDEMQIYLTKK